jgi:hypothetical protein
MAGGGEGKYESSGLDTVIGGPLPPPVATPADVAASRPVPGFVGIAGVAGVASPLGTAGAPPPSRFLAV